MGKGEKKELAPSLVKNGDLDHSLDLIIPLLLEEISGHLIIIFYFF